MDSYARTAGIGFFVHDRSLGRISVDSRGQAVIEYRLNDEDKHDVMAAMRRGSEILFAAGAKSVVLPYNDLVEIHHRPDVKVIEQRGILANDPLFLSFHPQGTLPMGRAPKNSIVDAFGAAHETKGLYVADASVFPTRSRCLRRSRSWRWRPARRSTSSPTEKRARTSGLQRLGGHSLVVEDHHGPLAADDALENDFAAPEPVEVAERSLGVLEVQVAASWSCLRRRVRLSPYPLSSILITGTVPMPTFLINVSLIFFQPSWSETSATTRSLPFVWY